MKDETVTISRDSFIDLMILLKDIVGYLPSMPHHMREALYGQINSIENEVLSEEE